MIVDATNGEIINSEEVYIHDDTIENFCFDRKEKTLNLLISKKRGDKAILFPIVFCGVIGFEMTSCDFWGSSPYILDFQYIKPSCTTLIPKLLEVKASNEWEYCPLKNKEDYLETAITFVSGDVLLIACEKVILD